MVRREVARPFPEIARDLARLDTGLISDALERAHGPGVPAGIRALSWRPGRIAGRAITVQLEPGHGNLSTIHLGARAIDSARDGDIIVVANEGRLEAAAWGGLLSLGAAVKGVRAVVIDGACRDVEDLRNLDIEVFCKGAIPLTARGRWIERSIGEPVRIAGVTVATGDWVVGDLTGVVFVPASRVEEVIAVAKLIAKREAALRRAIVARQPVSEVFEAYESLMEEGE